MREHYYILSGYTIIEISEGKSSRHDLRQFLEDGEAFGLEAVRRFFGQCALAQKSKVSVLLANHWLSVRFVALPKLNPKNTRLILSNHLTGAYVEDIEDIHFNFYKIVNPIGHEQQDRFIVYSCLKSISEAIRGELQKKGIDLVGIFPYTHWLEQNIAEQISSSTPAESPQSALPSRAGEELRYTYLCSDFALIAVYSGVDLLTLSTIPFDEAAGVSENLDAVRQEYKILEHGDDLEVICSPVEFSEYLGEKSSQEERRLPDGAAWHATPDFAALQNMSRTLKQRKKQLNLMRSESAYIRDLYRSGNALLKVGVIFACSLVLVCAGLVITRYRSQQDLAGLDRVYATQFKQAIPDSAAVLPIDGVIKIYTDKEEEWNQRKEFYTRQYSVSSLFKHLSELKQLITGLQVDKIEYRPRILSVDGAVASIKAYDLLSKQLTNRFPEYSLSISYSQQKERVTFQANLTHKQ